MQFDEVLKTFGNFFEREDIRYVVIGGLALQAWGQDRFTNDADFAVDIVVQARVVAFAESLGYETLFVSGGYSNHLHPDRALGRVDIMYLDPRTAESLFEAATSRPVVGGIPMPVASPEHLSMMKGIAIKNAPRRAGRDMGDVGFLLDLPGVDRDVVREYYSRHGLLREFDAITNRRR